MVPIDVLFLNVVDMIEPDVFFTSRGEDDRVVQSREPRDKASQQQKSDVDYLRLLVTRAELVTRAKNTEWLSYVTRFARQDWWGAVQSGLETGGI